MIENSSTEASLKRLNIVFLAMCGGLISALLVFIYIVEMDNSGRTFDPALSDTFMIVVPVMALSAIGMGKFLYRQNAQKARESDTQEARVQLYFASSLIVFALLEGVALFTLVSYLLTANQVFLAFFSLIFLMQIYNRPSATRFSRDFNS